MGCTGWRRGVIALQEDNIIEQLIASLPAPEREATTRQPVPQENEFNLDLQWKPKLASLKGLWFRLSYAHNWQWQGGHATVDELRLIVNYHFSLL
jgi:hypothetical protein